MQDLSDEGLVRLVREGETQAFDILMRRYLRPALAVALQYAPGLDEAEDIVQDAFLRSLRQLHRFDERLRFAPWFFTILRNLARNEAVRRARPAPALPARDHTPDAASDAEIREIVDSTLREMTSHQQACFRLCEIDGFSAAEVGDMLGMTPPTVRTHAHRARLKLREELTRLGYGSET